MAENIIIEKCWGCEEILVNTPRYCAKYLYVQGGFVCSNHRHLIKDETFICVAGEGFIKVGYQPPRWVRPGDTVRVEQADWHYFGSFDGMTLLEVSTHHDDADVERQQGSRAITWDDRAWWTLRDNSQSKKE